MQRHHNKVIDSVSASDLLQALNTLKAMANPQPQFQISFSKENIVKLENFPDFPKNPRTIDYDHFMAGKDKKTMHKHNDRTPTKSPLLEQKTNEQPKVSNFKSRSHSPLDKRSERTESRVSKVSRQPLKKTYETREVRKKEQRGKKQVVCPSSQSKKILEQKEKGGSSYIPIQYRAEDLLREKQEKITRLQKERAMSRILEEKECTFKPQIKPYYKKGRAVEKDDQSHKISEYQRQKFEDCFIDQEFICASNQPKPEPVQQQFYSHLKPKSEEQLKCGARRYKNQKFNYLLDLIQ